MLYLIDGKYYVNTSPLRYTEVLLVKKNGKGDIVITKNRIEVSERTNVVPVSFADEIKKISEPKKEKPVEKVENKVVYNTHSKRNRFDKK